MSQQFDLVVVGGGMVGAAIALGLAHTGQRIALVEHQIPDPFDADQPIDLRVSALSPASITLLESLDVWGSILSWRACPYRRMRVWELDEDGEGLQARLARQLATEFNSDELGLAQLGYIVENRLIQRALIERLQQTDVELVTEQVSSVDYSPGASLVELDSGDTLVARLLVAADGGNSLVRTAAALGVHQWDYSQQAMVINITTADGQQDITWQQFTPSGPHALLPLPGNHASLVWYESPQRIKELLALSDEALIRELYEHFPERLGEIRTIDARGAFPLRRLHALQYYKRGVVLAGDSAHQINPLAGQGVNLGFQDVKALVNALSDALARGERIDATEPLAAYEKSRRNANLLMIQAMDAFYHGFSNEKLPLKLARNLILGLGGTLTPLRKQIIKLASGL
ncbi:MAG TPA: FAD-dependent monooxygenase [Marinobacterium sp.]|nr:FAD-dependent monooxygenase [Marinobacterium sp.]